MLFLNQNISCGYSKEPSQCFLAIVVFLRAQKVFSLCHIYFLCNVNTFLLGSGTPSLREK